MELEAKRKRALTSSSSLTGGDRLSSLPDCLIHRIMSFMKARQVVQTCVLSTRWRYLWRSLPCINIDQQEFKTEDLDRDGEGVWEKFEDFTDHLLIPNNISIALLDTFKLHIDKDQNGQDGWGKQAAKWIRRGIKYSTQEPGFQPHGLSSSSWRLKRLHFSNINLDDSFMNHVRSGCQCLENLYLKGCTCIFHEITPHSLKRLILLDCSWSGLSAITSDTLMILVIDKCQNRDNCILVIMTPAVAYLYLSVVTYNFPGGVLLNDMPSINKAYIRLAANSACQSKLGDDQFNLLDSVSNVTTLCLSYFKPMVLSEKFAEFGNLRTLLLEQCDISDNFQILGLFLHSSPNLEKLTLRNCKFSKDPKEKKGKAKLNKGSLNQLDVRCKNLKQTEIIFKDDDVIKLVELLLSIPGSLPKNNIKLTRVD